MHVFIIKTENPSYSQPQILSFPFTVNEQAQSEYAISCSVAFKVPFSFLIISVARTLYVQIRQQVLQEVISNTEDYKTEIRDQFHISSF
jgi:hypothetical protein